ncbi:MAG: DNA polymerase IV, partial [Gammaproteobacteria bacterium]
MLVTSQPQPQTMSTANSSRWIAHVDLDAFFASCEQRDDPALRGRPVIVGALPGQRGVVAAASYEARAFGVHSAMPIGEAARRCPDAVYLRPDMDKYRQVSRQVMAALQSITPLVEVASVDEAYLDVSGLKRLLGPPAAIGERIKSVIREATALTASVGIGPNRLLAKLGSEHRKPDGLTIIRPDEAQGFLDPLPVSALRGAGPRAQAVFRRLGIGTIRALRDCDPERLTTAFGRRAALGFLRQARGEASAEVLPGRPRKSISKETTFQQDIEDQAALRAQLVALAAGVARTARRERLAGHRVTLKVRYRGFETHTRQRRLTQATQDERVLARVAAELLADPRLPQRPVRLIGVGLSDWA